MNDFKPEVEPLFAKIMNEAMNNSNISNQDLLKALNNNSVESTLRSIQRYRQENQESGKVPPLSKARAILDIIIPNNKISDHELKEIINISKSYYRDYSKQSINIICNYCVPITKFKLGKQMTDDGEMYEFDDLLQSRITEKCGANTDLKDYITKLIDDDLDSYVAKLINEELKDSEQ